MFRAVAVPIAIILYQNEYCSNRTQHEFFLLLPAVIIRPVVIGKMREYKSDVNEVAMVTRNRNRNRTRKSTTTKLDTRKKKGRSYKYLKLNKNFQD